MSLTIRRLAPGDEAYLTILAEQDADFDLEERGGPREPLAPEVARRFLANPAVLTWAALEGDELAGFLYCLQVPLRSGVGQELLLYEIGVRARYRRSGAGRALLAQMEQWMRDNDVDEVWVLADNEGAVAFYRACQFEIAEEQPVYLTRELN